MIFVPFPGFAVPIWPAPLAMTSRIDQDSSGRTSLTKRVDNVRQNLRAESRCGITLETANAKSTQPVLLVAPVRDGDKLSPFLGRL